MPQDTRGRLARLVDDCLQGALALESALHDERQALEQQDDTALNAAAAAKRDAVSHLERLDEGRQALCRETNRPATLDSMPGLLGADPRLGAAWQRFLDCIAACDRRNTANGTAIQLRQRQLAAALAILRGGAGESAETYDPLGGTRGGRSRRALARI